MSPSYPVRQRCRNLGWERARSPNKNILAPYYHRHYVLQICIVQLSECKCKRLREAHRKTPLRRNS